MKQILCAAVFCAALSAPAYAALKPGDMAQDFSAQASLAGKEFTFSLKKALKKGPVVVYFYPSAYTRGCDLQAHTFAENKDKFSAAGATIIGVSQDSISRLHQFSADPEFCAGKFPVASDRDGSIAKSYDLKSTDARAGMKDVRGGDIDHAFTERVTFVITKNHKIVATFASTDGLSPVDHVDKSLAIVEQMKSGKAP